MIEKNYKSEVSCRTCNKKMEIWTYRLLQGRGGYCSKSCYYTSRKGIRVSPQSEFKNGHPFGKRIQKGQHLSPATEFKLTKGKPRCLDCGKELYNYNAIYCKLHAQFGERGSSWKGDNVGYGALHHWVKKNLGEPLICWYCNTSTAKKYHWANRSGEYKRDLNDWFRLCVSCHHFYDRDPIKRQDIADFLGRLI